MKERLCDNKLKDKEGQRVASVFKELSKKYLKGNPTTSHSNSTTQTQFIWKQKR
jgi:hypothetical protein